MYISPHNYPNYAHYVNRYVNTEFPPPSGLQPLTLRLPRGSALEVQPASRGAFDRHSDRRITAISFKRALNVPLCASYSAGIRSRGSPAGLAGGSVRARGSIYIIFSREERAIGIEGPERAGAMRFYRVRRENQKPGLRCASSSGHAG